MSKDLDKFHCSGSFSSPPCYAAEIAPDYFDPLAVDAEQARDVARWRKAERKRLRNARQAMSAQAHLAASQKLCDGVRSVLADRFSGLTGEVLAAYWPTRGEPDLRPLMHDLYRAGMTITLPVVVGRAAPLAFRLWTPQTKMVPGDWNIPVPPHDLPVVQPTIVLTPLVGWTEQRHRLGNGGGYYDRTLAALRPNPFVIGIGFEAARLSTIYPQPHDVPLDLILSEQGVRSQHTAD